MATYRCVEIESSQSTGHFSFETFVCVMAKSQIKFGVRDRQIFSRAKKAISLAVAIFKRPADHREASKFLAR